MSEGRGVCWLYYRLRALHVGGLFCAEGSVACAKSVVAGMARSYKERGLSLAILVLYCTGSAGGPPAIEPSNLTLPKTARASLRMSESYPRLILAVLISDRSIIWKAWSGIATQYLGNQQRLAGINIHR